MPPTRRSCAARITTRATRSWRWRPGASTWGIDLGAIPAPVTIWFGSDDEAHSPDLGVTLARRLHARRNVVEQAAGALLWTHGHLVLDCLGRRVE